jgi:acyl-[acyl-carrier-protein]-phospholipid O-acyltransferase/long-chain-fatty-acid--[acyl-carrier-protein] ligase
VSAAAAALRDPRSFALLNGTQFLTVFNDNVFKQTVVLLAIERQGSEGNGQALAQMLFSLPFLLFAAYAGDFADRRSKRDMVVWAKWAEVGVMLFAAAALASEHLGLGLVALFLMAAQSAVLGPAKYGAMVEYSGAPALARANGLFQAFVMAGIVTGTACAGLLFEAWSGQRFAIPLLLAGIALIGALLAARMRAEPPVAPARRATFAPLRRLRDGLRQAFQRRGLGPALLGHALFWFISSLAYVGWNELIAVQADGGKLVDSTPRNWSLGLAFLGLCMGIGAAVCGRCARSLSLTRLTFFGGSLLAIGFIAAGLVPARPAAVIACGAVACFGSGFFVIPLRTAIQRLAPPAALGAVLGTSQALDFLGVALGGVTRIGLRPLGLDARAVLVVTGATMALGLVLLARGISAAETEAARSPA